MVNKMAEFPGKLAIFGQKAASLREAVRWEGSPENLKTQGGILEIFDLRGVFWLYPLAHPYSFKPILI